MVDFSQKKVYNYDDLVRLMAFLRSEQGCVWDREQTHDSIRRNFIEETYEACEAIDCGDDSMLCEELGDVLLQVIFHAQIAAEQGAFTMQDVINGICNKMVIRHPHVFGDVSVDNSDDVVVNWDAIKEKTKGHGSKSSSMVSVAKTLPALIRAEKVQAKAAKFNFDWPDAKSTLPKIKEELAELEAAINTPEAADELGDLIFSAVNTARHLKIDPEASLNNTTDKFIKRIDAMERLALLEGKELDGMSLSELDRLWNKAKSQC